MYWLEYIFIAAVVDLIELGVFFGTASHCHFLTIVGIGYLVIALLLPFTNTYLLTRLAGSEQETFAKSFTIASALGFAMMVLLALIPPEMPADQSDKLYIAKNLATLIPWVIGFALQIVGARLVSDKHKSPFIKLTQLRGDAARNFVRDLKRLTRATNIGEANSFAATCLERLAQNQTKFQSRTESGALEVLVEELVRQKFIEDANVISLHYLALVSK